MPEVTPLQWREAASRAGEAGRDHEVSFGSTPAELVNHAGLTRCTGQLLRLPWDSDRLTFLPHEYSEDFCRCASRVHSVVIGVYLYCRLSGVQLFLVPVIIFD